MTMYVPAPENEEIRLTNLYGDPMMEEEAPTLPSGVANPNAGKLKEAIKDYQRFLLDRLTDPKFLDKKEGIDALELLHLARKQIFATKGKVGVHAFDTEVATRLQACILHPSPVPPSPQRPNPGVALLGHVTIEHNWIDWARPWKLMSDRPPAVLALPEEQRAEPQGAES